jgi:hypothetical protein
MTLFELIKSTLSRLLFYYKHWKLSSTLSNRQLLLFVFFSLGGDLNLHGVDIEYMYRVTIVTMETV